MLCICSAQDFPPCMVPQRSLALGSHNDTHVSPWKHCRTTTWYPHLHPCSQHIMDHFSCHGGCHGNNDVSLLAHVISWMQSWIFWNCVWPFGVVIKVFEVRGVTRWFLQYIFFICSLGLSYTLLCCVSQRITVYAHWRHYFWLCMYPLVAGTVPGIRSKHLYTLCSQNHLPAF